MNRICWESNNEWMAIVAKEIMNGYSCESSHERWAIFVKAIMNEWMPSFVKAIFNEWQDVTAKMKDEWLNL